MGESSRGGRLAAMSAQRCASSSAQSAAPVVRWWGVLRGLVLLRDAMNAKLSRRRNRFTLLPVVLRIVLVLRVHADN